MFSKIPESWMPLLKNMMLALLVIVVIVVLYSLMLRGLRRIEKKHKLAPSMASLIRILVRWIAVTLGVFLSLDQLGVLENIWAALLAVLAMVAVGFVAVWSVLSNMLCTLLMLIYKPFQVGDDIEIPVDNLKGRVVGLNLMFTSLEDENGDLIQVPNNFFFQKATRRSSGSSVKN